MTEKQKKAIAKVLALEIPPEAALTIIEGIMESETYYSWDVKPYPWDTSKDSIDCNITNK